MALITGSNGTDILEVGAVQKAARVAMRPVEANGWLQVGAQSGGLTTIAANAPVFSFRNISSNLILVRRVAIKFLLTTAFTTAQQVEFGLFVARAFTASDSGGTAITLTGNNAKVRTSLSTLTSVDARISAAAALTAGTRTLDTNTLGQSTAWGGAAGGGHTTFEDLLNPNPTSYPLVLAQNEGFVISNLLLMGTAGAGKLFVNVELGEASAF